MSQLLRLLAPLGLGAGGGGGQDQHLDDNFTDRLHHSYSTLVFVVLCLIVSTKQYVGDPIHCWVPGHFTKNYEEYTNKICWVSNTYFLPPSADIPATTPADTLINYYQWVPMLMLLQGIFFYMPYLVWRSLNCRSGIDLNNIIEAAKTMHISEHREKTLRYMIRQMDRYLGHYRQKSRGCCAGVKQYMAARCHLMCGKKYGNYMVTLYILVKVLYIGNAVAQLFILNAFLTADFHLYGIQVIEGMIWRRDWPAARIFPKTTMCDYEVRALGNTHRHTVQCVLTINFFNEKLYVIIWFWLVLLLLATAADLCVWLYRVLCRRDQMRYVKHLLRSMDKLKRAEDKKLLRKFVCDYLRQDGVFVVRLINANVNSLAVSEFVAELWEYFLTNPRIGNKAALASRRMSGSEMDEI